MRVLTLLVVVLGCGGSRPAADPPSRPNIPKTDIVTNPPPRAVPPSRTHAEVVTELVAPTSQRTAAIAYTNQLAVLIDEAGVARFTTGSVLAPSPKWIAFSAPVDDVLFFEQFVVANVPGPQLGKMFCGRTRALALECVLDFEQTPQAARSVRRFRLPVDVVRQFGVFTPWPKPAASGPDHVICALGRAAACFSFDWAGTYAEPYTLDAATTESVAMRIAPASWTAWSRASPHVSAASIREVVHTDRKDDRRIIHDDADVTVHCARLESGELSCFGPGVYGELGDGTLALTARASRPLGDAKVIDVAADRHRVCAVVSDGRVACWGDLGDSVPVPNQTKLPACPLDRAASHAKFTADRTAAIERARDCSRRCRTSNQLDACLACVTGCTKVPYLFDHKAVCQEPQIDGTLQQQGMACVEGEDRAPRWLTDAELGRHVSLVKLFLSPAYLPGVTDAIAVTVDYHTPCVLRRGGQVACLFEGKLSTSHRP